MIKLLQEWVEAQANQRPDATAIVFHREAVTYGQLEEASNQFARLLLESGCNKGDRIALVLPKSPSTIIAMLGALKAGCIHAPVDPGNPASRLALILEALEPRCVLAAEPAGRAIAELVSQERFRNRFRLGWFGSDTGAEGFSVDFRWRDLGGFPTGPPECPGGSGVAHILFTSGSTGIPKGVMVRHSSVIEFVTWAARHFDMRSTDRLSGHSPFHFDLSTFDIFGAFAAGASLYLVPPEINLLPPKLAAFIRSCELTQWFSVPSVLNYMAKHDALKAGDFPSLKRLLWCGEVFPTPPLIYWMRRLPHVRFTNLYGPTETTIASSYYDLLQCPEDERTEIPIGRACPGEELVVLDDDLRPVAIDSVGTLYIRGVGISPGYWHDPEKTQSAFRPIPDSIDSTDRLYNTGDLARIGPDGLFYLLGRCDSQIKSRGYRIELGEIEKALNTVDGLQECAVVAIPTNGFEGSIICCAYVPAPGVNISPPEIRNRLVALLPPYMIPSRWMARERLPLNQNGKIDRPELRRVFSQDSDQASRPGGLRDDAATGLGASPR